MLPSDIDIGANIRAFRKKKGLSLNELSQLTGISASNLSSMELGKSSPTLSTLTKIASAFAMKPGTFLDQVMYRDVTICRKPDSLDCDSPLEGFTRHELTAAIHANKMKSSVIVLSPGGKPMVAGGQGADFFVYCTSGEVRAKTGDENHVLAHGDSMYLLPEACAELSNNGSNPASILVVTLNCRRFGQ